MTNETTSVRTYMLVFGALLALTVATVLVARIDLGVFNAVAAIVIASVKATLVGLFFMHLVHSKHRTSMIAVTGLAGLILLIALTLADELTRSWIPVTRGL